MLIATLPYSITLTKKVNIYLDIKVYIYLSILTYTMLYSMLRKSKKKEKRKNIIQNKTFFWFMPEIVWGGAWGPKQGIRESILRC